jgi:hypothetical protein
MYIDDCVRATQIVANGESTKPVKVVEIAVARVTEGGATRGRRGHDQLGLVRQSEQDLRVAIIGMRGYPGYYGGFETAVRILTPFLAEKVVRFLSTVAPRL